MIVKFLFANTGEWGYFPVLKVLGEPEVVAFWEDVIDDLGVCTLEDYPLDTERLKTIQSLCDKDEGLYLLTAEFRTHDEDYDFVGMFEVEFLALFPEPITIGR